MKQKNISFIKKVTVLALVLIVATVGFAACSSKAADSPADTNVNSSSSSSSSAEVEQSLDPIEITNVSYDPTRELYEQYNKIFQAYWLDKTGQEVTIVQSHGGSGKQARSVLEGNDADVVTLALEGDVAELEKAGLIDAGWVDEFDKSSAPYTSTIVFLVRKGNPKNLNDWNDIVKPGVEVITPDPKTSGGAKWNFLAAWSYALQNNGGDEAVAKEFVKSLYSNVTVLDSGARGATTTFTENQQGDVLLAWENEAFLSLQEHPDDYDIVTPSISILAQPSVAVVDSIARKHGTEEVAKAYLEYLYSDEAQQLAGENYYRPSNPDILKNFSDTFKEINLVNIDDDFGGWNTANDKFFVDGAIFDQIYKK